MIEKAIKRNKSSFKSTITIIKDDILKSAFSNKKHDLIVGSFGMKCIPKNKYDALCKSLHGHLNHDGIVCYADIILPTSYLLN
jgi:hypothetical protein